MNDFSNFTLAIRPVTAAPSRFPSRENRLRSAMVLPPHRSANHSAAVDGTPTTIEASTATIAATNVARIAGAVIQVALAEADGK